MRYPAYPGAPAALRATGGNKSHAAKQLGLSRYGLLHKIKRFGLEGEGKE